MMALLQMDYLKVAVADGKRPPYESNFVREAIKHCIPLRFGDTTDIATDIRLTLQNAGHIIGSAIAHFHIGDGLYNIVATNDMLSGLNNQVASRCSTDDIPDYILPTPVSLLDFLII